MPLGIIAEVLAHGGFLPQLAQLNKKKGIFNKKNGVVFGVFWFIFLTMFSTAFLGILGAPDELLGIIAITGVFGAMMIILASLVFLPSSKQTFTAIPQYQTLPPPSAMYGANQPALPPQSIPANMYGVPKAGSWRDTNDLEPTNTSEGATKLLDREDQFN
ncbi:MAG: hypothetical protein ACKVQJ_12445 [Pyrinomonadaceae bacterium]